MAHCIKFIALFRLCFFVESPLNRSTGFSQGVGKGTEFKEPRMGQAFIPAHRGLRDSFFTFLYHYLPYDCVISLSQMGSEI